MNAMKQGCLVCIVLIIGLASCRDESFADSPLAEFSEEVDPLAQQEIDLLQSVTAVSCRRCRQRRRRTYIARRRRTGPMTRQAPTRRRRTRTSSLRRRRTYVAR